MKRRDVQNKAGSKRQKGSYGQCVPFEMTEFKRALKRVKESAAGQDGVSYGQIKHLSGEALGVVLDFIKQDLDRRGFTEELDRGNSYSHKEAREGS